MKVLGLRNLQREEGQIFYLRKYTCEAIIELPTETQYAPLFFTIETSPIGKKIIELSFQKPVNYPLVPLKKAILECILAEEIEGKLPC